MLKQYENVLVHVIDAVLIPPSNLTTTAGELNLTGLVSAVEQANGTSFIATAQMTPLVTLFGMWMIFTGINRHI